MAFKSFNQYQEDKNGQFFVLPNDGDQADVIFLYKSVDDVLVADVHYISTNAYKGYAHCCGDGCPACNYRTQSGNGIRKDNKIFVPLYNIQKNRVEFWDRSTFFESVLQSKVFRGYPDPSMCVFRITRRGAAGSRDTKYDIDAIARNSTRPYKKICADFNLKFPDAYSAVCREMSVSEMDTALNSNASDSLPDYGYTPIPRTASEAEPLPFSVPTPTYSEPPVSAPPAIDLPDYNADTPPINQTTQSDSLNDSASGSGDDLDNVTF